jgi:O-acetyl-ADP-ribose deacetylase (regulator of RNase III)
MTTRALARGIARTMKRIFIVEGDITALDMDAIVNAANDRLVPGGGVCGAIHRAAGPELAQECARIGACPTGEARITKGYRLKAKHVIHAVGPVWHGGKQRERELLASCYRRSLELAVQHKLKSIAFPAISTGIYGYPPDEAARVAVKAVADFLAKDRTLDKVVLCCFGQASVAHHQAALKDIIGES